MDKTGYFSRAAATTALLVFHYLVYLRAAAAAATGIHIDSIEAFKLIIELLHHLAVTHTQFCHCS